MVNRWRLTGWAWLLVLLGIVIVVTVVWRMLLWNPIGSFSEKNEALRTLIQALGAAGVIIGGYLTLRRVAVAENRHITERFASAVGQLASEAVPVRLGAVYALERIAKDSAYDQWAIMELLATTLLHWVPLRGVPPSGPAILGALDREEQRPEGWPRPDVQAAVTAIGRRHRRLGVAEPHRLDLRSLDLGGIVCERLNLQAADLSRSSLYGALVVGCDLRRACLFQSHLAGATVWSTDLSGADLRTADLCGVSLTGSVLDRCDLRQAKAHGLEGWRDLKSVKLANIWGIKDAPQGFEEWARGKGAVAIEDNDKWERVRGKG